MRKTASEIAEIVLQKCAQEPVTESQPYAGQNAPEAFPQSRPSARPQPKPKAKALPKPTAQRKKEPWERTNYRYTPAELQRLRQPDKYPSYVPGTPTPQYIKHLRRGGAPGDGARQVRIGAKGRTWRYGPEGQRLPVDPRTYEQRDAQREKEYAKMVAIMNVRPHTYSEQFEATGPSGKLRQKNVTGYPSAPPFEQSMKDKIRLREQYDAESRMKR